MDINDYIIPLAFLAIGSFGELIDLRHPSPGQWAGTILGVLVTAGAGFFVPIEWAEPAIVGFAVAKAGRVSGLSLSWVIDKVRVWRVG